MSEPTPKTKIPIKLPPIVALAILGALAACIAYLWPVLLTRVLRRTLSGAPIYALSFAFAAATLGFAAYCAIDILPATDSRVVYSSPFDWTTLYVVPALVAWGAAGFGWAGLGGVGSLVALAGAAAWGLKPVYASWAGSSGFWAAENPYFYGAGAALVVVAAILALVQVITLRDARALRAAPATALG